jgi:acyl-CoA synthetase (AMP-forming)/AMP-acid ligase II
VTGPTNRRYGGDWIVASLLADRADRFADEPAVFSEDRQLSWADLVMRAERVAGFLAAIGLNPGDRVATMLPSTIDYLAAWHGIVWCNCIDVPVNTEYKGMFLERILRDSGARAMIVDAQWTDRLERIALTDLEHLLVVGEPSAAAPAGLSVHRFADALVAEAAPLATATTSPTSCRSSRGSISPTTTSATRCSRCSIRWVARPVRLPPSGRATRWCCAVPSR